MSGQLDRLVDVVADVLLDEERGEFGINSKRRDVAQEIVDQLVWKAGFADLVAVAQLILAVHYPPDVFVGRDSLDSGVRFVTRLRDALAQVHAEPEVTGE